MTADALIEAVAKALHDTVPGSEAWGIYPAIRAHFAAKARAALSAIEANGYRVVPVEPTGRMIADGAGVNLGKDPDLINVASITWRAMLSAAPKLTEPKE